MAPLTAPTVPATTQLNLRLVVCALLSIVMMVADHRYHHLEAVRDTLSTLLYPLHYLIQVPAYSRTWISEHLARRSDLLAENADLRRQQLLMSAQLQKLTALEAENRRLRALLESSTQHQERLLVAELLRIDFDPYRRRILLNRGSQHGVQIGQVLLDAQGVVGQIIHANRLTSEAILITDPNHALPVQVVRNGLRTLAQGTGDPQELELSNVLNNADIRVGDRLISSGLDGRFPHGYPVATVTSVAFDPARPYARIKARPLTPLDRSQEFLIILNGANGATLPAPATDEARRRDGAAAGS